MHHNRDYESDSYGGGAQGYGSNPSYGSGGAGYNPGYIDYDTRPTTDEPRSRYRDEENEEYDRSKQQGQGYGSSAGQYSRPYGSANEQPSSEKYAPRGSDVPYAPAGGYLSSSSGPPQSREYGASERPHGPGSGYEDRNSRHGGSQEYTSGGQGYRGGSGRDEGESYGGTHQGRYGAVPASGGGYTPSDTPHRGDGYGGRDSSYDARGQGYNASGESEYGVTSSGGYKVFESGYGSNAGPGYNSQSQSYGGPHGSGAESRDEYLRGNRKPGYNAAESEYGTKDSGYEGSQSYGGPRREDKGDEYSASSPQYSSASVGANAPAGGFLSGAGGASRHDGTEATETDYGTGGRNSGRGGQDYQGRGDSDYDSQRPTSGYNASDPSYSAKPAGGYNSKQSYGDSRRNEDTYSSAQPHGRPQTSGYDEDKEKRYKDHLDAHAQAYGPGSNSNEPMDPDVIGAAAAVEALKLTAAGKQSQGGRTPSEGRRPVSGDDSEYSNTPSGGLKQSRPTGDQRTYSDDEEEEGPGSAPAASKGGSMQDKIVSLAMSQAGKLFDKKNGGSGGESGDAPGKGEAMQSAASAAMRLCSEYQSTGKLNLQPGEMQQLIGAAMSLF
ncbi:hypothetical protein ID866_11041 [Astraeus odoratus]|nr:hypothetical protein ID866_11041 [Astraeus odoratus]